MGVPPSQLSPLALSASRVSPVVMTLLWLWPLAFVDMNSLRSNTVRPRIRPDATRSLLTAHALFSPRLQSLVVEYLMAFRKYVFP